MSSLGSKVLHPRSVELAMKYDIKIHVRSSFKNKLGSMVVKEDKKLEKEIVTGITSSENDANISVKGIPDKPGVAGQIFSLLSDANITVDMIVQNITDDGKFATLLLQSQSMIASSYQFLKIQKSNLKRFRQIKIFLKFLLSSNLVRRWSC